MTNLTPEHLAHLLSFSIDEKLLAASRVYSIPDAAVRSDLALANFERGRDLSGICFPYFDPALDHPQRLCSRVRLDHPLEGGNKYVSEPQSNRLYTPFGYGGYFKDATVPIIFVESEKAALAIASLFLRSDRPTQILPIATGGCWGWLKRRGKKPLKDGGTEAETGAALDFDLVNFKDRKVYVAFDSNVSSRKEVRRARNKLLEELSRRSAAIAFVDVPEIESVNGPDDFIRHSGDDAFLALIDKSVFFDEGAKPYVAIMAGEQPEAVDQSEQILVKHTKRLGIFQRGGEIVRVVTLPEATSSNGLARPAGTIILNPLTVPTALETLERLITYVKFDKERNKVKINCPDRLARAYLDRKEWHLPILRGVIFTPVLRRDGSILKTPGYDEKTRLFLTNSEKIELPRTPTKDDALAALDRLLTPFMYFPYVEDADRSVVVAAILTAIQRKMLEACPIFGFSAPSPRTGKSLLSEAVAIISTGKPAPATAVSSEKEEFRKALTSALREGASVINLDNVEVPLRSADLCKIITQPEFSDRLLGETTMLRLPTNVVWTATGNNLTFRGDLSQRALLCSIDAKVENPEKRPFDLNVKEYVTNNRMELVSAALTILIAYQHAGSPRANVDPWGGFDDWSDSIRQAILWLGEADPCKTRENVVSNDPEKESAILVYEALSVAFGSENFTSAEVAAKANERLVADDGKMKGFRYPDLHEALFAIAEDKGRVDSKRLGWWLRSWNGRIVGNLRLVKLGENRGRQVKWTVLGGSEKS